MRATGVIRRVDDLGRVVIPIEIRKKLGLEDGSPLEIFTDEDEIILRKCNVSVGLWELVRRLDNEFSEIKNDMDAETADKIYRHINALHEILKDMDSDIIK